MIIHLRAMTLLYGGCALLYMVLVALLLLRRPRQQSPTARWLTCACGATAIWAAAVAVLRPPYDGVPAVLELARSAIWYGFVIHLYRTATDRPNSARSLVRWGLIALLALGCLPSLQAASGHTSSLFWSAGVSARLILAIANILLLENLYRNSPADKRWHLNLLCVALGGGFVYDLILYADALLFHRISYLLFMARAPVTALIAPMIAVAAARNRRWEIDIHVSREVVFYSATLVLSGIFLLGIATTGEIARRSGAEWGMVAETSMMFGGALATGAAITSASVRSRIRSMIIDHFFSNRYDYRKEWMRCIDTLTAPIAHTGLPTRAIRAVAEVVDSPAGVLFVRAPEEAAFQWVGSWNMPSIALGIPPGDDLIREFRGGDWIVELDHVGPAQWIAELPRVWLAVPLDHFGTLIGFVILARSRAQFRLDREAFDLLRIVGREVASRVAEQRAAQILSQTRQLREYSQRFAFVLHDIKNVSGQLSMLLTNAEIHAENPEFQRDMLATVRASVGKISRLLGRLQADRQERSHALTSLAAHLRQMVENYHVVRDVQIMLDLQDDSIGAAIRPEAFDAIVTHLVDNALEASGGSLLVIRMRRERLTVVIDIVDQGPGMTPEFIRDELFRPFATSKREGYGIGAYQARELLREAGGDLLVDSQIGAGTTMRLLLPAVQAAAQDAVPIPA